MTDSSKKDYKNTLNLLDTGFSMRANAVERDPQIQKKWLDNDIYGKVLAKNKGKDLFVLHDGPPYANGHIHIGHTIGKTLKDIIIRYESMNGKYAPYIPGWDCHGLPIEHAVAKKLGSKIHDMPINELLAECRKYANEFVNIQREEFKKLGVRGDWDNPYLTMSKDMEAGQLEVFGKMAQKGYIYKGLKPVYWCASCRTALAEAEVEYADHTSIDIYVGFRLPIVNGRLKIAEFESAKDAKNLKTHEIDAGIINPILPKLKDPTYVVIWTTTPWTLPANVAISVNPDMEYELLCTTREDGTGANYLVAKELKEKFLADTKLTEKKVLASISGSELEGICTEHPFTQDGGELFRYSPIICGEHVTLEAGTGCVHTAPGHGMDDYNVGLQYGMEIISPVNDRGVFAEGTPFVAGEHYTKVNDKIFELLGNRLLSKNKLSHSYPHCWRCKNPVIYRATPQWFASVDGFRSQVLDEIKKVEWIPPEGENRISSMIEKRGDWCISRQRKWGVPIPVIYCADCGEEVSYNDNKNSDILEKIVAGVREKGLEYWWETPAETIAGSYKCSCGGKGFTKETDIMDVWFDSGSTHYTVLRQRGIISEHQRANLYLEGSDQHRGWFQSSILTSVAISGHAPYQMVLTHGFLVDGEGRKMSKSLGNGIELNDVIKNYGTDILRLWVASSDYRDDVRLSQIILKQITDIYRKIRNTVRFLLINTSDYNPADPVKHENMRDIDRYILAKTDKIMSDINQYYKNFEFYKIYQVLQNYCINDLSSFYLDITKDRLYTWGVDSVDRRAAQTAYYEILMKLVTVIAPIMPHMAQDALDYVVGEHPAAPDLLDWVKISQDDGSILGKWEKILEFKDEVNLKLESMRKNKEIGHSLDSKVTIGAKYKHTDILKHLSETELSELLIVSQVGYGDGDGLTVEVAGGHKCERCWNYKADVGTNTEHTTLCVRCADVVVNIK